MRPRYPDNEEPSPAHWKESIRPGFVKEGFDYPNLVKLQGANPLPMASLEGCPYCGETNRKLSSVQPENDVLLRSVAFLEDRAPERVGHITDRRVGFFCESHVGEVGPKSGVRVNPRDLEDQQLPLTKGPCYNINTVLFFILWPCFGLFPPNVVAVQPRDDRL